MIIDLQSPTLNKTFPYLKTDNLSNEDREKLLARLKRESGKMQDKFAILVDRTRESLEKQNISCNNLKVLVLHSQNSRLLHLLDKSRSITDLFIELWSYWSFFDYEFLSVIVNRHCSELTKELRKYVFSFKEYCERRICEVPVRIFDRSGEIEYKLYVKCDHKFDKNTLKDVKELECQSSDLLDTDLGLLGAEEGCMKLVFNSLCAISTPLKPEQVEAISKLGILRLFSDDVLFYDSNDVSTVIRNPSLSVSNQANLIPDYEIQAIAEAIEDYDKVEELAEALYMNYYLDKSKQNAKTLLELWQKEMESSAVSPRPYLIYHLARLGMQDLHKK